MDNKIIIAIDGYSACGKSSTAKLVANALGYFYIDTGAMYRAVTLFFQEHLVDISDVEKVDRALDEVNLDFKRDVQTNQVSISLNGTIVGQEIRSLAVNNMVSEVAALKAVRKFLVKQQRRIGKSGGVVMDGRDIGTNVFPKAELKIFMTADFDVRAKRRQLELAQNSQEVPFDDILENLKHRDFIDTTREENPLKKAEDAVLIDTTHLTIDGQVQDILELAYKLI